jgi:hypothetical protein
MRNSKFHPLSARLEPFTKVNPGRDYSKRKKLSGKMSMKISLLVLAAFVLWAGWRAFVSAPVPGDPTHRETELPSQFSAGRPELNAVIEAKIKAQQRSLADYLSGSADFRRRLDENSGKYSLSPEDHKPNEDLNLQTGESLGSRDDRH